jgi:hypothetical protein
MVVSARAVHPYGGAARAVHPYGGVSKSCTSTDTLFGTTPVDSFY